MAYKDKIKEYDVDDLDVEWYCHNNQACLSSLIVKFGFISLVSSAGLLALLDSEEDKSFFRKVAVASVGAMSVGSLGYTHSMGRLNKVYDELESRRKKLANYIR